MYKIQIFEKCNEGGTYATSKKLSNYTEFFVTMGVMNNKISIGVFILVAVALLFVVLHRQDQQMQTKQQDAQIQNDTNPVVERETQIGSTSTTEKRLPSENQEDFVVSPEVNIEQNQVVIEQEQDMQTAMFANGCFWCVEADLQKVNGVITVVSGYADGTNDNPTYENYGRNNHREVVEVTYNAAVVSYGNLVEHILKHGDVTDPNGSFGDRGAEYAPALYYKNEIEQQIAIDVVSAVSASGVYDSLITIEIIPNTVFWKAEEYHQDYAEQNPLKYFYYRTASGRTAFIEKYWGERANVFEFS